MDDVHKIKKISGFNGLIIALLITVGMMVGEFVGGLLSNSLALLGDAGHMLTDVFSIGLSLFALSIAKKPPDNKKTFGYHRMEVMAALINGTLLLILSIVIFYEAYKRFIHPPEINGSLMLFIAVIGLTVNVGGIYVLKDSHTDNLNIHSAFFHIVGDTLSSLGVIIGGVLILWRHWYFIDPILSIIIGIIIVIGAVNIIKDASSILLENVPSNINLETVNKALLEIKGVKNIHDLHVWTITSGLYAMSSHVSIDDKMISEGALIIEEIKHVMKEKFKVEHTTIQLECDNCECEMICNFISKKEKN